MTKSDLDLLREYSQKNSEDSFAALVTRHVNLVYSAALRQTRSPQLAEEVSQSVFTDLARNASRLARDTVLTAWLYQVTRRTAIDVVRRESRRQLREQIATEMNAMNDDAGWTHIEPLLDEAMDALDEQDRAAVLLRYFENKSLREVGDTLGTSDDAAQKRVSRAVERLREFFVKRGVTIGAAALIAFISANAIQAAPASLAAAIITAGLAGTALATTTAATATKAIAMTTLQKSLVAVSLAIAAGAGLFEWHQASQLSDQVQLLRQQQSPLAEQLQEMQRERDSATNRLALLVDQLARLKQNNSELLRLRGEAGLLRKENQLLAQQKSILPGGAATPTLNKGFGNLGEYLPAKNASDAGNSTPEALLQTLIWAIRENKVERLEQIGAPLAGQSKPGDTSGEISESEAPMFKMIQTAFTNAAGFHLSSKMSEDGQRYDVRLDTDPVSGSQANESLRNLNVSFVLEHKADGWSFGNQSPDSSSQ